MKAFWFKLINFYLYSSLHISIAVAALIVWTYELSNQSIDRVFMVFCFAATLLMYTVHRLFGLEKIPDKLIDPRFEKIRAYRSQLFIFGFISLITVVISYFYLTVNQQKLLILPVVVSSLYALPLICWKRARDIPFLKIFLIAIIWAYITIWIPLEDSSMDVISKSLLCLERFCFIFTITLPFDIRDLEVDKATSVKTIPIALGPERSITLALFTLLLAMVISFVLSLNQIFSIPVFLSSLFSYLSIAYLIKKTNPEKTDYYYSGVLDGTMISHSFILFITHHLLL